MNIWSFEDTFETRVNKCRDVLVKKAEEYAQSDDRLHNFKKAAGLNKTTPENALWGMLTKHIVSLSDMVENPMDHDIVVWDEKIGDALNYLFLLDAVVKESMWISDQRSKE